MIFNRRKGDSDRVLVRANILRYNKNPVYPLDRKPRGRDYPLLNISKQGIGFITDEPLPRNEQLCISLGFPALTIPINFKAKICWTAEVPGKSWFHAGARILQIHPTALTKLHFLLSDKKLRNTHNIPVPTPPESPPRPPA